MGPRLAVCAAIEHGPDLHHGAGGADCLLAGFALVWGGIDLRAHSQTAHGPLIGGQDQTGGQGHSHRTATCGAHNLSINEGLMNSFGIGPPFA